MCFCPPSLQYNNDVNNFDENNNSNSNNRYIGIEVNVNANANAKTWAFRFVPNKKCNNGSCAVVRAK